MRKIFNIFALLALVLFASCSSEDAVTDQIGYLSLNVKAASATVSRADIPSDYNAKQLAVRIENAAGEVVQSTDDFSTWVGKKLALYAGSYTIKASSNGWDGNASGRDVPYYTGSAQVTVSANTNSDAEIVCTQANVKVSVQFDETISNAFMGAEVEVSSELAGINSQTFELGNATSMRPAFFPVGNLTAKLTVVNKSGEGHTMSTLIEDVKARDHYILKYSTSGTGNGKFVITADDEEKQFTYTFDVPTQASTVLKTAAASAWSSFAYLQGTIPTSVKPIVDANVKMQYKKSSESSWTEVATTKDGDAYKVTARNLTPLTSYSYKLVYTDGEDVFESEEKTFTTEAATVLPNGNMDNWCTGKFGSNNCIYPCSQSDWNANQASFWGTSNAGTSLLNRAVTEQETNDVHTAGGSSAKLASQYIVIKFAAASLFTGTFLELIGTNGGKINFGQPFTARPSQFKGWFKYNGGDINRTGTLPSYLSVKKGDPDTWSCYIALMTEQFVYDNSTTEKASSQKYVASGTMIDYEKDPRVVAYGELPIEQCGTQSSWKQFSIDLKYRDLTTKPSYIVIVISSSRYGDFFTGSDSSTLYIDDLELVYGEPTLK